MSNAFFHLLNIDNLPKMARWFAIRQYGCANGNKDALNDEYFGKLQLVPLSTNDGVIDGIARKFTTSTSTNDTLINNIRIGMHKRIGIIPPNINMLKSNPHTNHYKLPTTQESPWLECMTTQSINAIQLEIQDEYGQHFKPSDSTTKKFIITISFADMPI